MATSASKIIAKQEKVLTAVAESVGSTLGSIAAGVNRVTNAAKALLPKAATQRRARKRVRKTTAARKRVRTELRRKTSSVAHGATRKGRKMRRSMAH